METFQDTIKVYMHDIKIYPLISKDDEKNLATEIANGNDAARQKLIRSNLRLVVKIAHDFKGLGLPLLDLISEGNIGLMRAVDKFDPTKGAKLSSYASWWIKQSMRLALSNQGRTIRIPIQSMTKMNRIKETRQKLKESLKREPTDTEIANEVDFSKRTVIGLRRAEHVSFSIHDKIKLGDDTNFEDIIPDPSKVTPESVLGKIESFERLKELIVSLGGRESQILQLRFGLTGNSPQTLDEISNLIGKSRERVRQIQNKALSHLKAAMHDEYLFN